MLMQKKKELLNIGNKSLFHMERRFNGAKRFWRLQMRKRSTVVTAGRVGFPGRVYFPRKHRSAVEMIKFVRKQIKLKRKRGFVLKRNACKTRQQRRDKILSRPDTAVELQNTGRAAQSRVLKSKKNVSLQSSLQQPQIFLESDKTEADEYAVKHKLLKRVSLTVGTSAYVPPKSQWPLNIPAPVPWNSKVELTAYGVYVDDDHCIFGDDSGQIVDFSPAGELKRKYQLPDGVRCIKRDGEFLYAGCNDGGLYDLTHGEPRLMCKIESFTSILWIDVYNGMICASDDTDHIALLNYEGEVIWKHLSKGMSGWMARIDGDSVYHGNGSGVTRYAVSDGRILWKRQLGSIFFGVQTEKFIYVAEENNNVIKLEKKSGKTIQEYASDSSCLSNEIGDGLVFAPAEQDVVCFDDNTGHIIYRLKKQLCVDQDSAMSMHYHRGRLYCVGNEFYVIDLTEGAIKEAMKGKCLKPTSLVVDAATEVMHPMKKFDSIVETDVAAGGIVVHCIKEAGKLRVRPLSRGYHPNWNCQFPRDIRQEGTRYWVERLIKAPGKFYRVFGTIKQIC